MNGEQDKQANAIGSGTADPSTAPARQTSIPQLSVENKPAPGQRGPVGMSGRTTYSRVNTGLPPIPDAGTTQQKNQPPRGMEFLPKLASQENHMTTSTQGRPPLQELIKTAMEGAASKVDVTLEAARQITNSGETPPREKTAAAKPDESLSTDLIHKLAAASHFAAKQMNPKLADANFPTDTSTGPGEGPNALGVLAAKAEGDGVMEAGQSGKATAKNQVPLQPSLQKDPSRSADPGNGLETNDSMQHPENGGEVVKNEKTTLSNENVKAASAGEASAQALYINNLVATGLVKVAAAADGSIQLVPASELAKEALGVVSAPIGAAGGALQGVGQGVGAGAKGGALAGGTTGAVGGGLLGAGLGAGIGALTGVGAGKGALIGGGIGAAGGGLAGAGVGGAAGAAGGGLVGGVRGAGKGTLQGLGVKNASAQGTEKTARKTGRTEGQGRTIGGVAGALGGAKGGAALAGKAGGGRGTKALAALGGALVGGNVGGRVGGAAGRAADKGLDKIDPGGKSKKKTAAVAAKLAASVKVASGDALIEANLAACGLSKVAEDAINPAKISGGKADAVGATPPKGAAPSEEGIPAEPSDVSKQKKLVGSNEAAINFKKRDAKADPKGDMKDVITEPAQTKSTDTVLQQAFTHTDAAGAKIASVDVTRIAAARSVLTKLASVHEPKGKKKKTAMGMGAAPSNPQAASGFNASSQGM